jgi:hypothetical protein
VTISTGNVLISVDAALRLRGDLCVLATERRVTFLAGVYPLRRLWVGYLGRNRTRWGRCRRGLCRLLRLMAALAHVIRPTNMAWRDLRCSSQSLLMTRQTRLPAFQWVRNERRASGWRRCRLGWHWCRFGWYRCRPGRRMALKTVLVALQAVRHHESPRRRSSGWQSSRCRNCIIVIDIRWLRSRRWCLSRRLSRSDRRGGDRLVTDAAHLIGAARMIGRNPGCAGQTRFVTHQTGVASFQRMRNFWRRFLGSGISGHQQQEEDAGEYESETLDS